jgi:hypothetical protein
VASMPSPWHWPPGSRVPGSRRHGPTVSP